MSVHLQAPASVDGASESGGVPLWAGFGPSSRAAGSGATTPRRSAAGSPPPPDDDAGSNGSGVLDGFFAQVAGIKVKLSTRFQEEALYRHDLGS
jgi:hypothetical protein